MKTTIKDIDNLADMEVAYAKNPSNYFATRLVKTYFRVYKDLMITCNQHGLIVPSNFPKFHITEYMLLQMLEALRDDLGWFPEDIDLSDIRDKFKEMLEIFQNHECTSSKSESSNSNNNNKNPSDNSSSENSISS